MRFLFFLGLVVFLSQVSLPQAFAQSQEERSLQAGNIAEKGGSWAGKRSIIVEPGLQYSHSTSNRLDITGVTVLLPEEAGGLGFNIGEFRIEKIRRDILTPSLSLRFGVSEFFQLNLKIPYIFRFDRITSSVPNDETVTENVDGHEIGDIEGGIIFHLLREKGSRPQLIGGVRAKSRTGRDPYGLDSKIIADGVTALQELPTGSGHWGVEPYLTILKTVDPAVLFANLGYFYHIKRDIGGIGEVDPSDSINVSFGVGYALNDKVALNTAYEQKIYTRSEFEGEEIPDTDPITASLLLGATYSFSDSSAMTFTLSVGLTEDSPDVQVSINLPFRYTF